jgi:calcium permeable stress-gated cation channel
LGTSIGFTLLLALGFSLLRPYNSVVYSPKLKIADEKHAPPPMGKGMLAWVGPVLRTKEEDLVDLIGLDATVFLRVLRMCRNIFLMITLLGCGILIPINLSKGQKFSQSNAVSKVTPVNTFGSANWGMTICAWLFNIILGGYLWWNYKAVLGLRRKYYDSPEYKASLHARTLMVNWLEPASSTLANQSR